MHCKCMPTIMATYLNYFTRGQKDAEESLKDLSEWGPLGCIMYFERSIKILK